MSVGLRGLAALDHCKLNGPWVGPALRNGQGLGYVPVATWEGREGKGRCEREEGVAGEECSEMSGGSNRLSVSLSPADSSFPLLLLVLVGN